MEDLFAELASHMLRYMLETPPEKRSVRHLAVIRQFLKDCGVSAEAGRKVSDTGRMSSMLSLMIPFGANDGSGH